MKRLWNRWIGVCRAWLCTAPQGFTTEFSQKKMLSQRLHAALTAPGARKKGVIALCTVAVLALGAGGLFVLRLEEQPAPSEQPLVICTDNASEYAVRSWAAYYQTLYPGSEVTISVLPPAYGMMDGSTTDTQAKEKREAAVQDIRVQLMTGRGPDLFLLGDDPAVAYFSDIYHTEPLFPDAMKTAQAGAFADLSQWMESDSDFVKDEYIWPLFEAGQLEGKQYIVPLSCAVQGVLLSKTAIEQAGFDETAASRDFDSFWQELTRCVPSEELTMYLLSNLVMLNGIEKPLVDYNTNTVNLDEQTLSNRLDVLETLHQNLQLPNAQTAHWGTLTQDQLKKRTIIAADTQWHVGFECAAKLAQEEFETRFFPIPNEAGDVTAYIGTYGAVRANSTQKEAAWRFLKIGLSEEAQCANVPDNARAGKAGLYPYWPERSLPVYKKAVQDVIRTYTINGETQPAPLCDALRQDYQSLTERITKGQMMTQPLQWGIDQISRGMWDETAPPRAQLVEETRTALAMQMEE